MKREDMTPERLITEGQILCLQNEVAQAKRLEPAFVTAPFSISMLSDVLRAASAALATLDQLGYTYHGGVLFKPPLGPASPARTPDAGVTDAQCERIVTALDQYAREFDRDQYGLPRFDTQVNHMRGIIRGALRAP